MPAELTPPPPGEDGPDDRKRKRQEMLMASRLARHAARKAADDRPGTGPGMMNAAFIVVVRVRPGASRAEMTHRLEVALCDYADEVIAVAPLT